MSLPRPEPGLEELMAVTALIDMSSDDASTGFAWEGIDQHFQAQMTRAGIDVTIGVFALLPEGDVFRAYLSVLTMGFDDREAVISSLVSAETEGAVYAIAPCPAP